MFKQIDTKYAMIILAVIKIIVLCIIIGLVVLNMAADKHITHEYKKLYIRNYELEQENENLRKINIRLREENISIGKQLDKFLGE